MVLNVHTSKKEGRALLNTRNMEYTVRMYGGVIEFNIPFCKI